MASALDDGDFAIVSVLCVSVQGFPGGPFDLLRIDLDDGVALGSGSLPLREILAVQCRSDARRLLLAPILYATNQGSNAGADIA